MAAGNYIFHRPYIKNVPRFSSMPKLNKKQLLNSDLTMHYANMNVVELPACSCKM